MRKLLVVFVCVMLALSLAACQSTEEETPLSESYIAEIHANLRQSSVGITTFVYDQNFSSHLAFEAFGAGVIYRESESYLYVLTNYHVVDSRTYDYAEYYVQLHNQETLQVGELIAYDPELDLAVLRFLKPSDDYQLISISTRIETSLQEGEFVLAFGKPQDNNVYQGEYIGMVSIDEVDFNVLHHSANVFSGLSGSALTDIHGNLIGINTWMTDSSQGTGLAVSIYEIYTFLENNHLLPE